MHEEHFYGKSFHNKQKMFLENRYKHTQILFDVIQWLVYLTLPLRGIYRLFIYYIKP